MRPDGCYRKLQGFDEFHGLSYYGLNADIVAIGG